MAKIERNKNVGGKILRFLCHLILHHANFQIISNQLIDTKNTTRLGRKWNWNHGVSVMVRNCQMLSMSVDL